MRNEVEKLSRDDKEKSVLIDDYRNHNKKNS